MFTLEYLPLAREDMADIARYISRELHNPDAAKKLVKEMREAAERLPDFPYANRIILPVRPLKYEYRRLLIKSYIMFYWIDERTKTINIARVIYAKRDYQRFL